MTDAEEMARLRAACEVAESRAARIFEVLRVKDERLALCESDVVRMRQQLNEAHERLGVLEATLQLKGLKP